MRNSFFFLPAIIWTTSFLYLANYYGGRNIFTARIHENGKRTLLQTIFYFNHFLREILIDTIFAFCIFHIYKITSPEFLKGGGISFDISALSLILLLLMVFILSIREVGLKNSILDFLQYRETDFITGRGSHWQMHFLSTFYLIFLFLFPATLLKNEYNGMFYVIFVLFVLLSIIFRVNSKAIFDKRWVLHGAREIVTFFLTIFVPFFLPIVPVIFTKPLTISPISLVFIFIILAVTTHIAIIYKKSKLKDLAQNSYGFWYLLSSHFFEHFLDFAYITILLFFLINFRL